MKNTKILSAFLSLVVCPNTMYSGDDLVARLTVETRNGTKEYQMYESGKLYFSDGYLAVDPGGGGIQKEKIANIRKLIFENVESSGLEPTRNDDEFVAFPNPASDWLELKGVKDETISYSIFTLRGEIVLSGEIQNGGKIYLNNLAQGVYTIKIGNTLIKFSKK